MRGPGRERKERLLVSWWVWVGAIDLFLIVITILKWYPVDFPFKGTLVRHFNLATEGNAAVWISGITLLLLAILALDLYERADDGGRKAWWMLSIVFAFLSFDEIGSIHERFDGWPDLFLLGGIPALLALFGIGLLFANRASRRTSVLILVGFLVLSSVAVQEHYEHLITWPNWALGIRAGLEEGSELLGFFILLWALIGQRENGTIESILPDFAESTKFPAILAGGLILHSAASVGFSLHMDLSQQGNPLRWYPQVVLFVLFAKCYKEFRRPIAKGRWIWVFMAFFFLLCSAGMNYDPPRFFGVGKLLAKGHLETALYICLIGALGLLCACIPSLRRQGIKSMTIIAGLTILHFYKPGFGVEYIIPGAIVLITHDFILRNTSVSNNRVIFSEFCTNKGGTE